MYGTVFRMRPKAGKEQAIKDLFDEWAKVRQPKVKGAVAGFLYRPEKRAGELIGVAVFSDQATYKANAGDPEQDRWYRRVRDNLQADPVWEDGEVISATSVKI